MARNSCQPSASYIMLSLNVSKRFFKRFSLEILSDFLKISFPEELLLVFRMSLRFSEKNFKHLEEPFDF